MRTREPRSTKTSPVPVRPRGPIHDSRTTSSRCDGRGNRSTSTSDNHVEVESELESEEEEFDETSPYASVTREVARQRKFLEAGPSWTSSSASSSPSVSTTHNKPSDSQEHQSRTSLICVAVICVLAAVGIMYFNADMFLSQEQLVDENWLRKSLSEHIRNVHGRFPSQVKDIWDGFYSGIRKVLLEEPTEPMVFLLVHSDAATTSCLAREVARVAHRFLNPSAAHPLEVDGAALGRNATLLEDHGRLVTDFRPLVEQHGVLVLVDLQAVPAMLARSLHIFCDTITPLVRRAVYIFTLRLDNPADGRPMAVAERALNSAWRQLDRDILSPLVARITGGAVFKVVHEDGVANTC